MADIKSINFTEDTAYVLADNVFFGDPITGEWQRLTVDDYIKRIANTAVTPAKATGALADLFILHDSADSNAGKQITLAEIFSTLGMTVTLSTGKTTFSGDLKTNGFLNAGDEIDYEILAGAITVTNSNIIVDVEGGVAASDNLDTINGGSIGDILYINCKDIARTVIVKRSGSIVLNVALGDCSLNYTSDQLVLIFKATDVFPSGTWFEQSRSINQ